MTQGNFDNDACGIISEDAGAETRARLWAQPWAHEVVQVDLRDEAASVARPVKALKGFRRLTLQPGETRTVTVTLHPDDLALYDLTMQKVVEPGRFLVLVGGSSAGGLERSFRFVGDTVLLAPPPPRVR